MKNRKVLIGAIIGIVVIIILIISAVIIIGNKEKEDANGLLKDYFSLINNKSYEELYSKVLSMNMSKEDFVKRNQNIYEGIDASNIQIEISNVEKVDNGYNISYHEKMYTSAGEVEFNNTANVVKENKELKLKWDSHIIFPQLGDTDKVRVSSIKAKRGTIYDRNNLALAEDGSISSVGIVPRKIRRK